MKLIKSLTVFAVAFALVASPASLLAQEKKEEHKQAPCCASAAKKSEACGHACCVEAAKKGKECEKCGGKGDIPKKKEEKKE